jgi:ATP synthase protein I
VTLPFTMLAGPLIGYVIGQWLDGKLNTEPYLMLVFLILGFVASGKETYRLLKRISEDEQRSDDNVRD